MEITGIILSGGKSSRMGKDKGLLSFNGKRMVEYSIDLLRPFCSEILISSNSPGYEGFGCQVVVDNFVGCGPIGGLEACLTKAKNDWCFVLACDTPFLEHRFLQEMISIIKMQDCIIPIHDNGIEPLVGIYNKKLSVFFKQKIEKKYFKLQKIIRETNVDFFRADRMIEKYPRLFMNLNSEEDINLVEDL